MNKKAVFFSISALLIVGLLFFIVRPSTITDSGQESTFVRVQNINQDRQLLEGASIPLLVTAETKRALNEMAHNVRVGVLTINNNAEFNITFENCVKYASCGGSPASDGLYAQLQNLSSQYSQLQYNTALNLIQIEITQIGTWTLLVRAQVEMQFQDQAGIAHVNKNVTIEELVSIEGLVDPFMSNMLTAIVGNTQDRAGVRVIKQHFLPASAGIWTPAEFMRHALNGTYIPDTYGPSYLGRFEQNPQRDRSHGIRSLFEPNTWKYASQQRSYVDYSNEFVDPVMETDCFVEVKFQNVSGTAWSAGDEMIFTRATSKPEAATYLSIQASGGDFKAVSGTPCTFATVP